jgi:SAM-dependent methyltransferase
MGEIFRRETAEHPEPFTGERLTTAIGGQVQIEHYHRYLFARSLCRGLDVLDVASGEGYGTALLAQVARSVIGVEFSGATARCASTNFRGQNLRFLQADARALPLADDCVDMVVSFETIEHFDRQDEFLREVRRVLRADGKFIVSTPDLDIYSPPGAAANPFHVRELSRLEFGSLLRGFFRHVEIIQQRALIGSALLGDTASSAPPVVFERRGDTHFEACAGLPRAPYVVALACDCELPPQPPSLFIDRSDLDSEQRQLVALDLELREAQVKLAETQASLARTQTDLSQVQTELARTTTSAEEAAHRAQQLELARAETEEALRRERDFVQRQHDLMQGSLRMFMRGYLSRLRRHLSGKPL